MVLLGSKSNGGKTSVVATGPWPVRGHGSQHRVLLVTFGLNCRANWVQGMTHIGHGPQGRGYNAS